MTPVTALPKQGIRGAALAAHEDRQQEHHRNRGGANAVFAQHLVGWPGSRRSSQPWLTDVTLTGNLLTAAIFVAGWIAFTAQSVLAWRHPSSLRVAQQARLLVLAVLLVVPLALAYDYPIADRFSSQMAQMR